MAADATAAGLYQSATSRFNPIESFMAGVQTAHAAKRLALAETGALFDVMLKQQGMQVEREQLALKDKLATEQTKIDWFNAQTNRLNATRPLRSSATSAASAQGGMPNVPTFGTDEDGNLLISFGGETPDEEPPGPIEGEGDGPEVTPLLPPPSDNGPIVDPLLGGGQQPPPTTMASPTPAPTTTTPTAPTAAPTTSPTVKTTGSKSPRLYVTGGSVNTKTGSRTFNWSTTPPTKDSNAPITPEMFETFKRIAATEGMKIGEMTASGQGLKDIKLIPIEGQGDISISSLPDDQQKRWATAMTELVTMAENVRKAGVNPTPAQKMAAVGVTDPAQMTPELWTRGYNMLSPQGSMDALTMKAREYAAALNLTFQGKKGYVPRTAETVLTDLGIHLSVPPDAQQPKPATPAAPTVATPTTPAATAAPAAAGGMPSSKVSLPDDTDIFKQIAAKESGKASTSAQKEEADRQLWETNKQQILRGIVSSGTDLKELKAPSARSQEKLFGKNETPSEKWLKENAAKLGIKAKDGGELKPSSVIFIDREGRKVTLFDLMDAALRDPRVEQALKAPQRQQALSTTAAGLTEQEKALLGN